MTMPLFRRKLKEATMMIKTICPYCGGRCETTGGPDGNPFNKDRQEKTVCTACGRTVGRTVSESKPFRISDDDLNELLTDADIIVSAVSDADIPDVDTAAADLSLADVVNVSDNLNLKISATAEGGGVKRNAETTVPVLDGSYSLGNDYPFGRRDVDRKPPFFLCDITIKGNEITIAGETFRIKDLPKTITKKLTAYGYGYVPWEETITIMISLE